MVSTPRYNIRRRTGSYCRRHADQTRSPKNNFLSCRYCLDGQKLVCISGTYGGDGATYRTETDTYNNIRSYAATGVEGPAFFIVQSKSGQLRVYGNTTDSRLFPSSSAQQVRVWAISRAEDAMGNQVSYIYAALSKGEYVITNISYTSADMLSTPASQVNFNYIPRSKLGFTEYDVYIGGYPVATTELLQRVDTYTRPVAGASAPHPIFSYTLEYGVDSSSPNSPLLTSITQCSPVDGACNSPYLFTYTAPSGGDAQYKTYATSFSYAVSGLISESSIDVTRTKTADFNGDGVGTFPPKSQVISKPLSVIVYAPDRPLFSIFYYR